MQVYVVTDSHSGTPVEVFKHYLHASECIEEAEKKGSYAGRYRIDGPFDITIDIKALQTD